MSHLIVELPILQELTGNIGRISQILVKLDNPAHTDQEVNVLNQLLKGNLKAISVQDFASQLTINSIPALRTFISVVTGLAVVVGFLVVFLSMYTAVIERTREIGILKALGAEPGTIVGILVRESVVLALVGALLGIVLSFAAKALILAVQPVFSARRQCA